MTLSADMEDQLLVERIVAGDVSAFEELVRRYKKKIFRMALFFSHDPSLAEDIVQEVFVRLFKYITSFEPEYSSLSTWIYTVTKNTCFSFMSKRATETGALIDQQEIEDMEISGEDGRSMDEKIWAKGIIAKVNRFLETLPATQREAFILRFYFDLSYEEMAQATGRTPLVLRQDVMRARRKLAELLGEDLD